MALFAGSDFETCARLGIMAPCALARILSQAGIVVGILVGIYQVAGAKVIAP